MPVTDEALRAEASKVASSEITAVGLSIVWPAATNAPAATAATTTLPRTAGDGAVKRCAARVTEGPRRSAASCTGCRWPPGERCRAKTCLPFGSLYWRRRGNPEEVGGDPFRSQP